MEELPARLVHARQVIVGEGLSDISEKLGLIRSGEFRVGNNLGPGEGFSGVRIGFPGFFYPSTSTMDSDHYNIAGVDVDTLAFGIRSSDGSAIFGLGGLTDGTELSRSGMIVGNFPGTDNIAAIIGIQFRNVGGMASSSDGASIGYNSDHRLGIQNRELSDTGSAVGILLMVTSSDGTPRWMEFKSDQETFKSRLAVFDSGASGAEIAIGDGAGLWMQTNSDSAGYLDLKDGGSTLTAPSDAYGRLYTRDGNLRFISSDGVDYQLNTT